jgi:hypothetical protein
MNYTKKSFSVNAPGTQQYRDNWERTFGPRCDVGQHPDGGGPKCQLPLKHEGLHHYEGPGFSVSWE